MTVVLVQGRSVAVLTEKEAKISLNHHELNEKEDPIAASPG